MLTLKTLLALGKQGAILSTLGDIDLRNAPSRNRKPRFTSNLEKPEILKFNCYGEPDSVLSHGQGGGIDPGVE